MRDQQSNDEALRLTLGELGIARPGRGALKPIAYSPPDEAGNRRVYEAVNKKLLSILERGPLANCIHITGEMRALADPEHRLVCERAWQREKQPIPLVCFVPEDLRATGRGILLWNRQNWDDASWVHHLDAFDLLADGLVSIRVSPKREPIHFSVFHDRFVLLQSQHEHSQHAKYVWFFESRNIAGVLSQRAGSIAQASIPLPPWLFREFVLSIGGASGQSLLFGLRELGPSSPEEIRSRWRMPSTTCVDDLLAIGFTRRSDGYLRITEDGEAFLRLLESPEATRQ